MKSVIYYLIGFCILSTSVIAQERQVINLKTVLELCDVNNLTVKNYLLQQELANARLAQAKSWWLPDIYGGIQTHQQWGAAMNTDGKFALENQRDNLWFGIGIDGSWDLAEGLFKTKSQKLKNSSYKYQTQAEKNKTTLEAINAYYQFLSAQMEYGAYGILVNQTDTIVQQITAQVEGGLGYDSDLLIAKTNLNHIKIKRLDAQTKWADHSSTLTSLLLLDPSMQLTSIDTLMIPIDLIEDIANINSESAIENRPEMALAKLQLEALEQEKKSSTIGLALPELRVNGYLSYFGDLNSDIDPLLPILFPTTNQIYPTQEINAALIWRIPMGDLFYKGDRKMYDAQMMIAQNEMEIFKANVNKDISSQSAALENAKLQIELAQESIVYAEEALSQSIARERLGTIRPLEIIQAQEVYIKAKLDMIHSVANYNMASYRLYVAMGNNL